MTRGVSSETWQSGSEDRRISMPWRVAGAGQDAGAQPAGRGADTRPPSDDAESRKRETSESADLEYGDSPLRPQGVSVDFIGVLGGGGAGGWRKLLGVIYCFYWCNIPYNVRLRGEFVAARIRSKFDHLGRRGSRHARRSGYNL